MSIKPWPEQIELAAQALSILRTNGLVYLAMEERTGKTLTSILLVEDTTCERALVVTKEKALKGWENTLNNFPTLTSFTLVNYHNLDKVDKGNYDIVVLDEPHAYLAGYPKPGKMQKQLMRICRDLPIIYLSATPNAQGTQQLYHQLQLSSWSPFSQYIDFYEWYKKFALRDKSGKFKMTHIGNNQTVVDYKSVDHDKVMSCVEHLFVTRTRKELGHEFEPEDVPHLLTASPLLKSVYNELIEHKVLHFTHGPSGKEYIIDGGTPTRLRIALHMLEGGTIKAVSTDGFEASLDLAINDKIDWIMKEFGDYSSVVIMYNYIAEGDKLRGRFKHAQVLQGSSYAEGVDLSDYKHLVIYSQDFSTAKHTQRRARQANKLRSEPIKVHYPMFKGSVGHQVYKTVSLNKVNFVDSLFEREKL